jgi:hypothetical protein
MHSKKLYCTMRNGCQYRFTAAKLAKFLERPPVQIPYNFRARKKKSTTVHNMRRPGLLQLVPRAFKYPLLEKME